MKDQMSNLRPRLAASGAERGCRLSAAKSWLARRCLAGFGAVVPVLLAGCGAASRTGGEATSGSTTPSYVSEPFTHQQVLIEQGARLIVSDGCSACHLTTAGRRLAPSFASFAGHRITLADGRRILVDEHFLREGLLHPGENQIKGYDPAAMLAAVRRSHLGAHPQQVAALAAFIEQIGPEP